MTQCGRRGASTKPRDAIVRFELDDAELRLQRCDDDRRGAAVLFVGVEDRAQVDVVQLVAVEREQRSGLLAPLGRKAEPSPTSERLGLGDGDDLRPQSGELGLEQGSLAFGAADDDAVDTRAHELRHLVLGERVSRDRHERLRVATGRIAQAGCLAAGKDDGFH